MRGTSVNEPIFSVLGFRWDRSAVPGSVPLHGIDRVCFRFHRMLPEFVWDASVLEGNPFTFPEVKTLLDGVTVGGRKLSDQEQVLNLAASSKQLLALVKTGAFILDKATMCSLHAIVARNEALEWGHFRGEGEETNYTPDVGLGERGRYPPCRRCPVRQNSIACSRLERKRCRHPSRIHSNEGRHFFFLARCNNSFSMATSARPAS